MPLTALLVLAGFSRHVRARRRAYCGNDSARCCDTHRQEFAPGASALTILVLAFAWGLRWKPFRMNCHDLHHSVTGYVVFILMSGVVFAK
jgi:hypothetical protein